MAYSFQKDFYRFGVASLAVYLPNLGGSSIDDPGTAPTVAGVEYSADEVPVFNGRRFNVGYTTPGSDRDIQIAYLGYDANGNLTGSAVSTAATVSPTATDNALQVEMASVPAGVQMVAVFIDSYLAHVIQSPKSCRRTNTAGDLYTSAFYEPNGYNITVSEYEAFIAGRPLVNFTRRNLPGTTGNVSHMTTFQRIDLQINGLPNETLTPFSMNGFSGTFAAPVSDVLVLFSGGTVFDGCGDYQKFQQVGIKSGDCSKNRIYEATIPGNSCYEQMEFLLYAKAVSGADTIETAFSTTEASNLPFELKEAPSQIFKGNISLSLTLI